MRATMENNDVFDPLFRRGFRKGSLTLVPATAYQLDANAPPLLFLNPAGAINFRLPASTAALIGLSFDIVNLSAFTITLNSSAGAVFTNSIVIATTQSAKVWCTGNTTAALGWAGMVAAGTQTSP